MRVPPFERFTRLTQAAAYVVLGAILGAMAYHAVFFMSFNALKDSYTSLEDKLNEYEDRIKKLDEFKDQHSVIKSIQPILLDSKDPKWPEITDEKVKLELKKKVKEDLDALVGTSIYKINANAELAWKLLQGKTYTLGGNKEFAVEIRTILVVDNVLQVWFRAKIIDRSLN
ncbi:hypothetical protein [Paenibacillus silvisoli]|uniref:hypothetical protein n=1 Tax=Paenibacillus silvisoli TaxID=3110539 RepID=UPI00280490BF|nr:hypothetical protein [Paenibacillus silvisoli]